MNWIKNKYYNILFFIDDLKTKYYDKKWFSKQQEAECVICHDTLNSYQSKANPREYGWWHCKSDDFGGKAGFWICHRCNGHHDQYWKRIN